MNTNQKIVSITKVLYECYDKLSKQPKPNKRMIGRTYYESTQLFSSAGNCLEIIEDCNYIKHGYSNISTNYRNTFIIKIGGAYKFSTKEIADELICILGGRYDKDSNIGIIDDFGTNY